MKGRVDGGNEGEVRWGPCSTEKGHALYQFDAYKFVNGSSHTETLHHTHTYTHAHTNVYPLSGW